MAESVARKPRRAKRDPHYHLEVIHSARLRIKVHLALKEHESLSTWLRHNGITCNPKKIISPSSWRISYGILTRFAHALGYNRTDKLYQDLTNPPPLAIVKSEPAEATQVVEDKSSASSGQVPETLALA